MRKFAGTALAGAAVASVAMFAAPASSAPPPGLASYDAGALSHALLLDAEVLDLEITAADTLAVIGDTPGALADGSALTTPLFSTDTAPSVAPGGPAENQVCATEIPLPPPLDVLDIAIGCVDTAAAIVGGSPVALSESGAFVIDVLGGDLTEDVLGPLLLPLLDALGPVLGALEPIVTAEDVLDALLGELVDADGQLLTITLAPGASLAGANEEGVLSRAVSNGAVIEVLPDLGPLLTVTVGASEASVVRDPATAEATPTITPAVVDFEWGTIQIPPIAVAGIPLPTVTDALQDAVNDLVDTLASSSPLACGAAGPLADLVCLDGASGEELDAAEAASYGFDFGPGTVGARTSALHLEVLPILDGGVTLALAEAVAAANAAVVQAPVTTTTLGPTTTTTPALARTGGPGTSTGAVAALAFAALGGVWLVKRAAPLTTSR